MVKTKEGQKQAVCMSFMEDQLLSVIHRVRYLAHIIRDDICDDDDELQHQMWETYAQADVLVCKFHMPVHKVC